MKTIRCWFDVDKFGIVCLTGEACGLGYRVLFDLTAHGKQIVEKCFGVSIASEPWNRGSKDDPHVASVMLPQVSLEPIGIFALLESGCKAVWQMDGTLFGIEASDSDEDVERWKQAHEKEIRCRFAYHGTAGDRNRHVMSGRIT